MKNIFGLIITLAIIFMGLTYFFEQPEEPYVPTYTTTPTAATEPTHPSVIIVENYQVGTAMYSGEWALDQPQGYGIMVYATGDRYEGVWDKGQMHGDGQFFWTNGDVYSGEFYFGARTGVGAYYLILTSPWIVSFF